MLRYVNLMITMLLGGLWHGAAWTFVAWGALHGIYLCINHAWNYLAPKSPRGLVGLINVASTPLTFIAVVVAWVFFRADSMASALTILSKMGDPRDIVYGEAEAANLRFIAAYAALVWLAPNTQELTGYNHGNRSVGDQLAAWRVRPLVFYATAVLLVLGLLGIHQHSEFIYFRF